jgi:hypothetical protein
MCDKDYRIFSKIRYFLSDMLKSNMKEYIDNKDCYMHGGNLQFELYDRNILDNISDSIIKQYSNNHKKCEILLRTIWSDDIDVVALSDNARVIFYYVKHNIESHLNKIRISYIKNLICNINGWSYNEVTHKIESTEWPNKSTGTMIYGFDIEFTYKLEKFEFRMCDISETKPENYEYLDNRSLYDMFITDSFKVLKNFKLNQIGSKWDKRIMRLLLSASMILNKNINCSNLSDSNKKFKYDQSLREKFYDKLKKIIDYCKLYLEAQGEIYKLNTHQRTLLNSAIESERDKINDNYGLNHGYFILDIFDNRNNAIFDNIGNYKKDINLDHVEKILEDLESCMDNAKLVIETHMIPRYDQNDLSYYLYNPSGEINVKLIKYYDVINNKPKSKNGNNFIEIIKFYTRANDGSNKSYVTMNDYMFKRTYLDFPIDNTQSGYNSDLYQLSIDTKHLFKNIVGEKHFYVYRFENYVNISPYGGYHTLKIGDEIIVPTIYSTTLKSSSISETITKNKNIYLKIKINKSANPLFLMGISSITDEYEVVLPFGSKLKVTNITDKKKNNDEILFVEADCIGYENLSSYSGINQTEQFIEFYKTHLMKKFSPSVTRDIPTTHIDHKPLLKSMSELINIDKYENIKKKDYVSNNNLTPKENKNIKDVCIVDACKIKPDDVTPNLNFNVLNTQY